jgi:hypothetical protein
MSADAKSIAIDLDMVSVGCDMHREVLDRAIAMLKSQADRVAELEESKVWHVRLPSGAYEIRYESGEMTVVSDPSTGFRELKLVDQRGKVESDGD